MNAGTHPARSGFPGEGLDGRTALWLLAATLPLFVGLGHTFWGSETRWAFVAQGMLDSGRWFEPRIAGSFMGYKPLLSYWAIAVPALPFGAVNEVLARLPSALAGSMTVLLTGHLAGRLLGRHTSLLAGVVLATSYTFVLWARSASADLLNLLFITAAIAVYVEALVCFRSGWIVLFFALLGIGCGCKGTPAVIVPLAVVGVDVLLARRFHLLAHWRALLLGAALGCLLFFAPFWLAYLAKGDWELLWWVWNENFVRATDAFDHVEPFWYYAAVIPAMLLPWSLWLPGGLAHAVRTRRDAPGLRFALLAFAVVVLTFSASESRRSYYVLPAFPYAALMISAFAHHGAAHLRAAPRSLLWDTLIVAPFFLLAAVLLCVGAVLLCGPLFPPDLAAFPAALPGARLAGLAALGAGCGLLATAWRGALRPAFGLAMVTAVALFLYLSTGVQSLREARKTERPFAAQIHQRFPGESVVFYNGATGPLRYYVGGETVVRRTREIRALLEAPGDSVLVACGTFCEDGMPEDRRYDAVELLRATQPAIGGWVEARDRYFLFRVTKR